MKERINITVDEELMKKVRERGIEVSGVVESALRIKTGERIIQVEGNEKCHFCRREEIKACRENDFVGMCWLCPDEVWICTECLLSKIRKVTVGRAVA